MEWGARIIFNVRNWWAHEDIKGDFCFEFRKLSSEISFELLIPHEVSEKNSQTQLKKNIHWFYSLTNPYLNWQEQILGYVSTECVTTILLKGIFETSNICSKFCNAWFQDFHWFKLSFPQNLGPNLKIKVIFNIFTSSPIFSLCHP